MYLKHVYAFSLALVHANLVLFLSIKFRPLLISNIFDSFFVILFGMNQKFKNGRKVKGTVWSKLKPTFFDFGRKRNWLKRENISYNFDRN